MADVLFVFVREDSAAAETLADLYDTIGFSLESAAPQHASKDYGASIIIWSEAAQQSLAFMAAAYEVHRTGRAVIASFTQAAPPPSLNAPIFDLSSWTGLPTDNTLDLLLGAVECRVMAGRVEAFVDAQPDPFEALHQIAVQSEPAIAEAQDDTLVLLKPAPAKPTFEPANALPPIQLSPPRRPAPAAEAKRSQWEPARRHSAPPPRPPIRLAGRIGERASLALFFGFLALAGLLHFGPQAGPQAAYAEPGPGIELNRPSALGIADFQAAPRETASLVRASYAPGAIFRD